MSGPSKSTLRRWHRTADSLFRRAAALTAKIEADAPEDQTLIAFAYQAQLSCDELSSMLGSGS